MPLSNKLECGKLRHRLVFMAPSGAQDTWGGVDNDSLADWQEVFSCWGSIDSMTAGDQLAAGTFVSNVSHKATIRNPRFVTVAPNMQIWFRGRTFIIQGVANPDETNKMLYLFTTEISNVNNPKTPVIAA
jgi:SPP1 family predicted phage head-tail adaptor